MGLKFENLLFDFLLFNECRCIDFWLMLSSPWNCFTSLKYAVWSWWNLCSLKFSFECSSLVVTLYFYDPPLSGLSLAADYFGKTVVLSGLIRGAFNPRGWTTVLLLKKDGALGIDWYSYRKPLRFNTVLMYRTSLSVGLSLCPTVNGTKCPSCSAPKLNFFSDFFIIFFNASKNFRAIE